MIATPLFDAVAAERDRLDTDWTALREGADAALRPHGTWRELTRTSTPGRAMARVSRTLLGGTS